MRSLPFLVVSMILGVSLVLRVCGEVQDFDSAGLVRCYN